MCSPDFIHSATDGDIIQSESVVDEVPKEDTPTEDRHNETVIDPSYFAIQISTYPDLSHHSNTRLIIDPSLTPKFFNSLDRVPVIDTHKVGILYVAPGQKTELDILRNTHGSPAYTRFLEGIGRLINLRGQMDVYAGGLDPDEDGEYAYAWWDDIGQILYHAATMMPTPSLEEDRSCINKKRHIGNDYVRIIWNDSGMPYRFDTLTTQFQFVNIVIEPHSTGAIGAFSNNLHETEYFKVTIQRAPGLMEFTPLGEFKLISAENLPMLIRSLSLLADSFASVFAETEHDTQQTEVKTNWQVRMDVIKRFRAQIESRQVAPRMGGSPGYETPVIRDFTTIF
jgi:tuberous sclerosis 2